MEKLLRRKILFKTVMILSLILGALGLVGTVVFSLFVMYLPLIFSLVFLGNALYGTVFYYVGYSNAAACLLAVPEIEGGARKISEIAVKMCRTEAAAETLLSKSIERGYIAGFVILNGELCETEANSTDEKEEPQEKTEDAEITESNEIIENTDITEGEN